MDKLTLEETFAGLEEVIQKLESYGLALNKQED